MKRRWLFLRGLARHQKHWGPFIPLFQEHFSGDQFEFLDLAGNGSEVKRESFLQISSNVQDLRTRSKLRSQGPLSVVAISMGAMVASSWADRFAGEIREMFLINTSSRDLCRFYERLQPRNYWPMLQLFLRAYDLLEREKAILSMTAAHLPATEELAAQFAKLPPTSKDNFLRQVIAASQYSFPAKPPQAKVVFFNSRIEHLVDPACTQRLAERWKAPLVTHPLGDHDLPLVDPEWLLQEIANWTEGTRQV